MHPPLGRRSTTLSALALVCALILSFFVLIPAQGATFREFENIFSMQARGDIIITGNGTLACDSSISQCQKAQDATGTRKLSNNDNYMSYADLDADDTTFNSTSATVNIPDGSKVLFAGLYWSGTTDKWYGNKSPEGRPWRGVVADGTPEDWKTVKLKTPGGQYQTITASRPLDRNPGDRKAYSAFADVTDIVGQAGAGEYWAANVHSSRGEDLYGGWSIVVAYENPNEQLRDLQIFDGFVKLTDKEPNLDTKISGFLTPSRGPVNATIGAVVWEGDLGLSGDYMKFHRVNPDGSAARGKKLSDAYSDELNFFNGTVSQRGELAPNRQPNYRNTMQIDAKTVAAPDGILTNGDTEAIVRFGTVGDHYLPNVLTTAIDVEDALFRPVKEMENLNGNDPAQVGDILEYRITTTNEGNDPSIDTRLMDVVPPGTNYVPGSIRIRTADGDTYYTDEAGDDAAEIVDNKIEARLGEGADGTTGGLMMPKETSTLIFQVEVDESAVEKTISNDASMTYQGETLKAERNATSNVVAIPVDKYVDLGLTKTGPAEVNAGEEITWTLTATNAGPSDADDVVVTDTLPEGTTFVSSTGDCTAEGATLTCPRGPLAADGSTSFTVTALIDPDYEAESITNSASVTSSNPESNLDNNEAEATSTLQYSADMAITKTVDPSEIRPGEQTTWTLNVTNNGPSKAKDVSVSDVLPEGLTFVSADAPCADDQGTLTCEWPTFASGATETVTVTTKLAADWDPADPVVNTATVSSSTPDPNADNNSDDEPLKVLPPQADLWVTKTMTGTMEAGKPVTYDLVMGNNGPSTATGVTLSDTLPDGLTNPRLSGSAATCEVAGSDITCSADSLAPGEEISVTVTADVDSDALGTIANTATVSSDTEDPNPDNDSSTTTDEVGTSADLAITKTASAATAGEDVTYTLTVTNNGPATARDVSVTDELPAELEFVSATPEVGACTAAEELTCSIGDLAADGTSTITVVMHVPQDVADASSIHNVARTSSPTPDPDETNNEADTTITTGTDADLEIAKTGPATVKAGEQIEWTITVTNNGPSQAIAATASDSIPDGVTGASATASVGSCEVAEQVDCSLGTIAAGDSVTITVTGTVSPDFAGTSLTNNASTSSDTSDPTTSNNDDTWTTTVERDADLGVTKTGPAALKAGEAITYTMDVVNNGPSSAEAAQLSDALPAGIADGATVTTDLGTCTVADRVLTCDFGTMAVGQHATVTLDGAVEPDFTGESITNTASVSSDTPDSNPANDSDDAVTELSREADLAVTKTGPETINAGEDISYTITVVNSGPSTAANATITDELPEGVADEATAQSTLGSCTVENRVVTCALGDMAVDSTATITIDGTVNGDFAGETIRNAASASSDTADPNPDNDSDDATTTVGRSADVGIVKTGPVTATAGEAISWTLEATNNGPSNAENVVVTDTLPDGVADEATATTEGGTCEVADRVVTCTLGTLTKDQSVTITLEGTVNADFAGDEILNSASVSTDTEDSNPDNDSDDAATPTKRAADVSIVKTGPETANAGEKITWTLDVHNDGPSVATTVRVSDELPLGVADDAVVTSTAGECEVVDRVVSCLIGDMAVGADVTITINAKASAGFTGDEILNSATVESPTPDPDEDNNGGSSTTVLGRQADVAIVKTGPESANAGEEITWTLTATNNGPSDAADVSVSDALPEGVADEATATTEGGTCEVADRVITCDLGTLAAGASTTITATGQILSDFAGDQIVNTATISTSTEDPNPDNDRNDATTTIGRQADVSIVKTGTESANAGEPISWTLAVHNDGPSVAKNVVVSDTLPEGVADEATASTDAGECTVENRVVTCTLGDLAVGADVTITIDGKAKEDFEGDEILNSATVTTDTEDPNPDNDGGSSTTVVGRQADVSVVKSATESVNAGEQITWTLTATNDGPSAAADVVITDMLPSGITQPSSEDCEIADGVATCQLGNLRVNDQVQVTITATVTADYDGDSIVNPASVSTSTEDPNPDNDADDATTLITRQADVSIVKTGTESANAGEPISWTLAVHNDGPSVAKNVVVTDELPEGVADEATASTDAGECTVENRVVTCTLGDLAVGADVTITIDGVAKSDFAGDEILNSATVTTDTEDPNPDNDGGDSTTVVTRKADVSIVKTGTETANAGEPISWTLTATNNGPSDAVNTVVTDTLPEGVADEATASTDAGECTVESRVVTCTIGTLASGASAEITVAGTVLSGFSGEQIVNSATVSTDTEDPNPDNDGDDTTTTIGRAADVSIVKTGPESVNAGEDITWTLTATNDGPSDAVNTVVTDTLPEGVADEATATSEAGECTVDSRVVTCMLGTLTAGASAQITITGTVLADFAGDAIANSATVSTDTEDPNPDNDGDDTTTTIGRAADISIVKTGPESANAGEEIVWTLDVTNAGPSDAVNTVVTDELPEGVADDATATTEAGMCSVENRVVSCALGTVASGSTVQITITATVLADFAGDAIANSATVTTDTEDPNPDNDGDDTTTTIGRAADISIVKTGPESANAGEDIVWTLDVTNAGPSDAVNTVVTDELPEGVADEATASTDAGECTVDSRVVSCALGTVASGSTVQITITATVLADFDGDAIANSATVSTDTEDPNPDNDGDDTTTTIGRAADISIVKTGTESANAGEPISWTIVVHNDGPSIAKNVVVTDTLPEGVADDATATTEAGECTVIDRVVTCTLGTVDVNVDVTISIDGVAKSDFDGDEILNSATVSTDTDDPNEDNDGDGSTTVVGRKADLSLVKSATESASAGEPITWTLTVTNNGPSVAKDVVVTDMLPSGITQPSSEDCEIADGVATCQVGTLPVNDQAQVTITAIVTADYDGDSIVNPASVTTSTEDPNPDNDADDATTLIGRKADVSIVKTGTESANAGEPISWTLVVHNDGPSVAKNVVVTDELPEGVADDATASTDAGECTVIDRVVTCTLGDVAVGADVTITIDGVAKSDFAGDEILNSATVSTDTEDPNPDNDGGDSTTVVTRQADVSIVKTGTESATAGEEITWTLTATNNGPSDAVNTVVTDTLPEGVADEATATSEAGECTVESRVVTCTLGTLASGASAEITVTSTVLSGFTGGEIVNTATVSTDTEDPNPDNDGDGTTTTVDRTADVSIVKTGSESVTAGEDITWTLTATNSGPSDAVNTVVTDELPDGVAEDVTVVTDAGECTVDSRVVTCLLGTLTAGGSAQITITGEVMAGFAGDEIVNSATVSTDTEDPNPDNDGDGTTTTVGRTADVSVIKTGAESAKAGEEISWTLEVTNAGPSDAVNTVVTDTLPEGVADEATASSEVGQCMVENRVVTCELGTLAPDTTLHVTITGKVLSDFAGDEIVNTASVTTDTEDTNSDNDGDGTTTTTGREADLMIVKTGTESAGAGEPISWNIVVSNAGPSDAANVVVTDTLPDGVADEVTVSTEAGECTVADRVISCELGTVPVGASVTMTIDAMAKADYDGSEITNGASVTSDTPDPDESNNSSTATSSVTQRVDLKVVKTGEATVHAGQDATWTLEISNMGPADAKDVILVDELPTGVIYGSFDSADGLECSADGQTVTCELAVLPAGASASTTITGHLAKDLTGSITNTTSVTSGTPENPETVGDNSDSVDSTVVKYPEPPAMPHTGADVLRLMFGAGLLIGLGSLIIAWKRRRQEA